MSGGELVAARADRLAGLKGALPVALGSVLLVTAGSVWWPPSAPPPADVPDVAVLEALVRWDAGWYGAIASDGYSYTPHQQSPVAFFPLYPLVIRALTFLGINRWLAAVSLSLACSLAGLALFARWARTHSPRHAPTAFWLLALYPFAEYLYGVVYSDALFLMMAVAAFLALEKDRPALAMLFGALATSARPVAPAVVLGLLVRSLERRRKAGGPYRWQDFLPGFAGLGLLAYMGFLAYRFDDPLAFAHVQGAPGWDQPPGWETWLKFPWFRTMFPRVDPLIAVRLGGHALVTVLALALVVPTFKRLGVGYGLYTLLVVGIPAVSSKDFQGLGRYVIAAFPLFLTLALLVQDKPRLRWALLGGFGVLLGALALALGAGGYVA